MKFNIYQIGLASVILYQIYMIFPDKTIFYLFSMHPLIMIFLYVFDIATIVLLCVALKKTRKVSK